MTAKKTGPLALLYALKTVLWSAIGLRKRSAHEQAVSGLRPWHFVVAILIVAATFIVGLITLARHIAH